MPQAWRKFVLTTHVICSVGWLGAVAAFLALALTGLRSPNDQTVRAAYLAMNTTGAIVIVPLCFAALVTGLIQSLGTSWGLFRHYWVIVKLALTVGATLLLLLHMQPVRELAAVAAEGAILTDELRDSRVQLVADAGAALAVLIVNTVLSVYKPRGITRYGWRKQREERAAS